MYRYVLLFFLPSRRRHQSWPRDWSSDVCSSDLQHPDLAQLPMQVAAGGWDNTMVRLGADLVVRRSEERRVGKEGRCRGEREAETKRRELLGCRDRRHEEEVESKTTEANAAGETE